MKKDVAEFEGRAPDHEVSGRSPEAETLSAFKRAMKASNLPAFSYLETSKNPQIYVFLVK